jgi:opacity protein-like surface antigen
MKKLLLASAAALLATSALAADLPPQITKASPVLAGSACTPVACSGFYAGGTFGGVGTNLDIIGSGVNNSLFAGGGITALDVGYQYANAQMILGLEASVGYQFQTSASVNGVSGNASGLFAYQIGKLGGNISALFGGQPPVTIPPQLAATQIGLYALVGAVERQFANGWATGAGAMFDIGPHSFVDLKYMHVQYGPSTHGQAQLSNENLVLVGLNYKW